MSVLAHPVDPVVLTLVHGTFASDAAWIKAKSKFANQLTEAIGLPVIITGFKWSGANNHAARRGAGGDLAVLLTQQFADHPKHRHFVIAHSHGGNVVLHAQGHAEVASRLSGIITLGTPFVRCEPRATEDLVQTISAFCVLLDLLVRMALATGAVFLVNFLIERPQLEWLGMLLGLPLAFLGVGYSLRFLWRKLRGKAKDQDLWEFIKRRSQTYSSWLRIRLEKVQYASVERINYEVANCPPLLAVMVKDDEARLWLSIVRSSAELPLRVTSPIENFLPSALKASIMGLGFVVAYILKFEHHLNDLWIHRIAIVLILLAGILVFFTTFWCLIYLLLRSVIAATNVVLRSHPLGFGGETILDNLLCDIFISETPNDLVCDAFATSASEIFPYHSSFMKSETVKRTLAGWIRNIVIKDDRRSMQPSVPH